jgi:hypothetical protein
VSYEQIDEVARFYQASGKKPLILLHQRHLYSQNIPTECVALALGPRAALLLTVWPQIHKHHAALAA